MPKKILVSLFLSIYVFVSFAGFFPKTAKALDTQPWYHQTFPQWYQKVYDTSNPQEVFGERYTAAQVVWIMYSPIGWGLTNLFGQDMMLCLTGGDLVNCGKAALEFYNIYITPLKSPFSGLLSNSYLEQNTATEPKNNVLAFFYNQPISGVGYVLHKFTDFKIVPEASAQGFGFTTGANPVKALWQATRDISYMLLVFVVIIMAFMIMFRVKLSPQVVVTVQSSLPKLIITIILITFSYAIAGLLIDLMYVVIGIFAMTVKSSGLILEKSTTIDLFRDLTSAESALGLTFKFALLFLLASVSIIGSSQLVLGAIAILFAIVGLLMAIFIGLKISWLLIKTFVNLMLVIVSAPLQILMGSVFPGMGFGSWVNQMASQLAVYPTVGILFFLAFVFLRGAVGGDWINSLGGKDIIDHLFPFNVTDNLGNRAWEPPLAFGTDSGRFPWLLAAFGIYAMIPKAGNLVQSIMSKKPFDMESAIGDATGMSTVGPALQKRIGEDVINYGKNSAQERYDKFVSNTTTRLSKGGTEPKTIQATGKVTDRGRKQMV